jgi:hypothetical protein
MATKAEFDAVWDSQGGKCAICTEELELLNSSGPKFRHAPDNSLTHIVCFTCDHLSLQPADKLVAAVPAIKAEHDARTAEIMAEKQIADEALAAILARDQAARDALAAREAEAAAKTAENAALVAAAQQV